MIRFILSRYIHDPHTGDSSREHFTLDIHVAALEEALRRGGFGDGGCDHTTLVGVEVLDDAKPKQEARS